MKQLILLPALLLCLALPVFSQQPGSYSPSPSSWQGRLSPDDQREFDRYYAKWTEDSRRSDRDEIASDARHLQDIMTRYNIPPGVPFEQVASPGYASGTTQVRLRAADQREFDKYYAKWLEHTRKNDRDDIASDEQHMREIMARYNIPTDVPFDRIASAGSYGAAALPPSGAYPVSDWRTRLSAHDQHEFDEHYRKYLKDSAKNDRDDVAEDARKMQEIMARYSIPLDVPFDRIATPGAYSH